MATETEKDMARKTVSKKQALDALDKIGMHTGKDSKTDYWHECFEYVGKFINSTDAVDLADSKKRLMERTDDGGQLFRKHKADIFRQILNDYIPDAVHLSGDEKMVAMALAYDAAIGEKNEHIKRIAELEELADTYKIERNTAWGKCDSCLRTEPADLDVTTESEQRPTKADLMADMQTTCDSLNRWEGVEAKVNDTHAGMQILFEANSTGYKMGTQAVRYRPDGVPPPKGNLVFVIRGSFTSVWFSCGEFMDDVFNHKCLMVSNESPQKYNGDKLLANDWYDIKTGHHSEDWEDEWTPEEFRKDANA